MAKILGYGHAVPRRIVSNEMLTAFMDTSDEWIQSRSGIKERHWARDGFEATSGEANYQLAAQAGKLALKSSQLLASEMDGVIYVTISPDREFPGSAALLQESLGIDQLPVLEIRNHCTGFIYGLMLARAYIDSGKWHRALLVASELQSTGLDVSTRGRNTAVLFGDGAGAVVLGPSDANSGILGLKIESDGSFVRSLFLESPGFARPERILASDFEGEELKSAPYMDGKLVFKMAATKMPQTVTALLEEQKLSLADLKLIIPHQANQRILDMLGHVLECPEKVFSNIARFGNTTGASIPLALSEAAGSGLIESGDLICLVSFGSGFSWGGALVKW